VCPADFAQVAWVRTASDLQPPRPGQYDHATLDDERATVAAKPRAEFEDAVHALRTRRHVTVSKPPYRFTHHQAHVTHEVGKVLPHLLSFVDASTNHESMVLPPDALHTFGSGVLKRTFAWSFKEHFDRPQVEQIRSAIVRHGVSAKALEGKCATNSILALLRVMGPSIHLAGLARTEHGKTFLNVVETLCAFDKVCYGGTVPRADVEKLPSLVDELLERVAVCVKISDRDVAQKPDGPAKEAAAIARMRKEIVGNTEKLHLLRHLHEYVVRLGSPSNFHTERFEYAHRAVKQNLLRASNGHVDVARSTGRWNTNGSLTQTLDRHLLSELIDDMYQRMHVAAHMIANLPSVTEEAKRNLQAYLAPPSAAADSTGSVLVVIGPQPVREAQLLFDVVPLAGKLPDYSQASLKGLTLRALKLTILPNAFGIAFVPIDVELSRPRRKSQLQGANGIKLEAPSVGFMYTGVLPATSRRVRFVHYVETTDNSRFYAEIFCVVRANDSTNTSKEGLLLQQYRPDTATGDVTPEMLFAPPYIALTRAMRSGWSIVPMSSITLLVERHAVRRGVGALAEKLDIWGLCVGHINPRTRILDA
jgi:hypothetical protein